MPSLRGICRHYGCLQHVDDVCSEVLLHIQLQYLNHPTYFESKQHLLAYAGQGARFCLWHIFREMRRLEFRDPRELPESLTRTRASEDDIATRDREELLALLADCQQALSLLATASPLIREVFLLHCEGASGQEIAQKLGTSATTVSRRLHDAFDLLRQTLNEN
jgi:RNA polymerase sigma factor (sigma-70 family)